MQRLVLLTEEDVLFENRDGNSQRGTLEAAAAVIDRKAPMIVGVLPVVNDRLVASALTVELAATTLYTSTRSFRVEGLEENVFQGFAIEDGLFRRIRQLGRNVHVVPYSVAVREALAGTIAPPAVTGLKRFARRLRVKTAEPTEKPEAPVDQIAVDALGQDLILTAMRGREVLASRRVRGDAVVEVQRTAAAMKMGTPKIFCGRVDLEAAFQKAGYQTTLLPPQLLIGWAALEHALPMAFLDPAELAAEWAARHRSRAVTFLAAAVGAFVLAAGFALWATQSRMAAERAQLRLQTERGGALAVLGELYGSRYPGMAHKESVHLHDELADLMLALPPQVVLRSIEKTSSEIDVEIERLADAAPFTRDDLRVALAASPYFGKASLREQYEGHTIRYFLKFDLPAAVPSL